MYCPSIRDCKKLTAKRATLPLAADLPEPVEAVNVVVPPKVALGILEECQRLNISRSGCNRELIRRKWWKKLKIRLAGSV